MISEQYVANIDIKKGMFVILKKNGINKLLYQYHEDIFMKLRKNLNNSNKKIVILKLGFPRTSYITNYPKNQ
jgi:hypothetical protein